MTLYIVHVVVDILSLHQCTIQSFAFGCAYYTKLECDADLLSVRIRCCHLCGFC